MAGNRQARFFVLRVGYAVNLVAGKLVVHAVHGRQNEPLRCVLRWHGHASFAKRHEGARRAVELFDGPKVALGWVHGDCAVIANLKQHGNFGNVQVLLNLFRRFDDSRGQLDDRRLGSCGESRKESPLASIHASDLIGASTSRAIPPNGAVTVGLHPTMSTKSGLC